MDYVNARAVNYLNAAPLNGGFRERRHRSPLRRNPAFPSRHSGALVGGSKDAPHCGLRASQTRRLVARLHAAVGERYGAPGKG